MSQDTEKISNELNDLEDANQKIFDEKVIAVLTAFLGIVFTFRDKLHIDTWTCAQKFLCAGMIIWITISLALVIYSYYYGAIIARKYNKQINKMLEKSDTFNVDDAIKNMECMNNINCFNFIASIVLICVNILLMIF